MKKEEKTGLMPLLRFFSLFTYGQPALTLELEDYASGILASVFARRWQQHALGQTIRYYAPQAWEQKPLDHGSHKKRRRH